jgi:tRNA-binding EMAP/Myf-like protein
LSLLAAADDGRPTLPVDADLVGNLEEGKLDFGLDAAGMICSAASDISISKSERKISSGSMLAAEIESI